MSPAENAGPRTGRALEPTAFTSVRSWLNFALIFVFITGRPGSIQTHREELSINFLSFQRSGDPGCFFCFFVFGGEVLGR